MEKNTEIQRAHRDELAAALICACMAGFLAVLSVVRWDLGGHQKAAYNLGYEEGLEKGLIDGLNLGQGEPKLASAGVVYTALYCEPDYPPDRRGQVCLVRRTFTGLPEFIKVPETTPAIKPGSEFKVAHFVLDAGTR